MTEIGSRSPSRPVPGTEPASVDSSPAAVVASSVRSRVSIVVLVAVGAYVVFVLLRLAAQGWDPTAFVAAGDRTTDPAQATELTVAKDSLGYDGQFFHRLARSPLSTERTDHGTTFDRPAYRQGRIGYPLIAWAASGGGRAAAVPWALIAVNLAALAGLTAGLAAIARDAGRSPWWALIGAGWSGFLVATSRDLSEVVAAALLVGGVWAVRERRWVLAAVSLTMAGLTRETALVVALGIVGVSVVALLRPSAGRVGAPASPAGGDGRVPLRVPLLVGLVPLLVVGAWRATLAVVWAGAHDTGPEIPSFVGVPIVALTRQIPRFVSSGDSVDLLQLVQLVAVVAVVVMLARALLDRNAGLPHERLALIGALVMLSMVPAWDRAVVFLRWPADAVVLGLVIALGSRRVDLRPVSKIVGGLFAITALMWVFV